MGAAPKCEGFAVYSNNDNNNKRSPKLGRGGRILREITGASTARARAPPRRAAGGGGGRGVAASSSTGLQRRDARASCRLRARRVVALRELIGVDEGARFGGEEGAAGGGLGGAAEGESTTRR